MSSSYPLVTAGSDHVENRGKSKSVISETAENNLPPIMQCRAFPAVFGKFSGKLGEASFRFHQELKLYCTLSTFHFHGTCYPFTMRFTREFVSFSTYFVVGTGGIMLYSRMYGLNDQQKEELLVDFR